jgi:exonuclease SbcC
MKILAIRGKNLASLCAEFEINYQLEPLRSAGLYAITGPTGAGKSTLLDTLCLALYEKTPRLRFAKTSGENIPDVGDNDISPSDARTILRRGAGEGYAEVDFVGSDGVDYRSRWSVRRARIKGDGKLQASEMTFTRIADGQALGDQRKTETLKRIEKAIGLSFEQFTRAVLLAQNDFATFLKASDDDRAELLQTLTGTSQFSDLSMRAYQRMKDEKAQLEQFQIQLQTLAPLAADQRAAQEAQAKSKVSDVKSIGVEKAALEDQLRWHQHLASLSQAVMGAKQSQEEAEHLSVEALPRRSELAQIDQVQEARPLWQSVQRLHADTEKYQVEVQRVSFAMDAAATRVSARAIELSVSNAAAASAETLGLNAQPLLDQAKALDVQMMTLQGPLASALQAKKQAAISCDTCQTALIDKRDHLQQAQASQALTLQWLTQHVQLQLLAEGWQRFETLFAQAGHDLHTKTKASAEIVSLTRKVESSAGTLITAQQEWGDAERLHEAAVQALDASRKSLAVFDAPQILAQRQSINLRREHLQGAAALWREIVLQKQNSKHLHKQRLFQLDNLSSIKVELQDAKALAPMLDRDYALLEQTLQIAQLAASESAEGLREQLQTGLACPVCGGLEHPYADHQPYQDAVLIALKKNVMNKQNERLSLTTRTGVLSGRFSSVHDQFEALNAACLVSDKALIQLNAAWTQLTLHFEWALMAENAVQESLDLALVASTSALDALVLQERKLQKAIQSRDVFQTAKDQAQRGSQRQKERVTAIVSAQKSNQQALQSVVQQIAELTSQIKITLTQLDSAFVDGSWQESWRQNTHAFVAQCALDALNWNTRQKQLTEFFNQIQFLNNAVENLTLAHAQSVQTAMGLDREHCRQEVVLQTIREKRKVFFDGKSTQDVESALSSALAQARQAQTQSQACSQHALNEHTRLIEMARQSAAQVLCSSAELFKAQSEFDTWHSSFQSRTAVVEPNTDLLLERLQHWLGFTQTWVATERSQLQEIENKLTSTQAVWMQQSQILGKHQAVCPTSDDVATVDKKLSVLDEALVAANEALTALRIVLAEDDKRLIATDDLRQKMQLQSVRSNVWARLGDLIGSADGKKFRNFAQQMTLDILLGYANSHLQSLTKRYRLQRIKNALGLLVVDQDMGDEVRSVHSLSGGESFLVSLALALGLASLSSHQVKVESLFIDEGFGSLDADALLLAMDALDKLQAQGRKVGVISHVQEMTERISTRVQVKRLAGGLSKVVVS